MSERDWAEIERLRQQVLALENAGMETAAQLGEAEAERDRYREALRQALTDVRCFETWFRKEDEGTGYGQPHLGQADARRSAERIERVLREALDV